MNKLTITLVSNHDKDTLIHHLSDYVADILSEGTKEGILNEDFGSNGYWVSKFEENAVETLSCSYGLNSCPVDEKNCKTCNFV